MTINEVHVSGHVLGFEKFVPPHATATDEEIATGVNYASGCSGIRDETGMHLVTTTCMSFSFPVLKKKSMCIRFSCEALAAYMCESYVSIS